MIERLRAPDTEGHWETVTPAGGRPVYLKAPEKKERQSPAHIRSAYRDVPSPIIRGRWTTTWADYTVTRIVHGPSWAEDLEHDASWFLTPSNAQVFADALASEVTAPMPTLSRVDTLWDPRRQIRVTLKTGWQSTVTATRRGVPASSSPATARPGTAASPHRRWTCVSCPSTDPHDGKTYGDLAAVYARYSNLSGTYQQVYDALPDSR